MRPLKNLCEVAVIGGGLAGLSAARHAARLGRLVTLFEESGLYGGQLATVGHVDGLPLPGAYSGQDLAIPLLEDVRKVGVRVIETGVESVAIGERITLVDSEGITYHPEAVIVASGGTLRKLGVPGEEALYGRGVSRCASCDGGFFRKQDVIVVGGGDAAVHEALLLAKTSRRVIMVCRSPLKAKREYVDRIAALENVDFVWNSEVTEILGSDGVTGARLLNLLTGESSEVEAPGIFPFVGIEPNSGFLPASCRTASGHVATGPGFATGDRRIFAAGAVRRDYDGNAVQAMAEGVSAAEACARLLAN
jgi:thioredoxin reductase (NADPH)